MIKIFVGFLEKNVQKIYFLTLKLDHWLWGGDLEKVCEKFTNFARIVIN